MLNTQEIMAIIPHRYPFLLVDRVVEIEENQRAVGIKNVTANEWFFQGHFPGRKVMPGVLIVEALAQVASVCLLKDVDMAGRTPLFGGIDNFRFRRPVLPGDQVRFELDLIKKRGNIKSFHGTAKVDGVVVAEADMMAMVADK